MSWSFRSPKATEALLHVFGICLYFQGVSLPVSSVPFVCIYVLTWGVHYLGYAMLRHNIMMWIVHNFLVQYSPSFAVSTILVFTGYPRSSAQKTEVISLEDNSKCQDVEDFPLEISLAVGSYLGSFPVICGGWVDGGLSLNQCHRLESGIWQPFATLAQRYVYIRFTLIFQKHMKPGNL